MTLCPEGKKAILGVGVQWDEAPLVERLLSVV